jgi:hypothetical protein
MSSIRPIDGSSAANAAYARGNPGDFEGALNATLADNRSGPLTGHPTTRGADSGQTAGNQPSSGPLTGHPTTRGQDNSQTGANHGPLTGHPTTRGGVSDQRFIGECEATRIEQMLESRDDTDEEIAAILNNASPEELNAIIAKLAADGKLDAVMAKFVFSIDQDFSEQKLRVLYGNLASKLDANNLVSVSVSMDRLVHGVSPFQGRATMFAQAMGDLTPAATKMEYVRIMSDRGLIGGVNSSGDPKFGGVATAYVLASMKDHPENAAIVLQELDDAEMRSVVAASASYRSSTPSLSRDVLEAAANVNDATLKSRMFVAAGLLLNGNEAGIIGPRKGYIVQGMAAILNSDTPGVIGFLSLMNDNPSSSDRRTAFVSYAREMFDSGQSEVLAQQLQNLLESAGSSKDAFVKWLYTPEDGVGGGTAHPNAEMLGFFLGGLVAGAKGLKGDPTMINIVIDLVSARLPWIAWTVELTDKGVDNGSDKWQAFSSKLQEKIFVVPPGGHVDGSTLGSYQSAYDRASETS